MAISNASNQIVKVNLIPGIIPSVLHLSQYDTGAGRPITFSVYDGGQAFTIPSDVSIAFEGTKPDGNGFSFTCSKSGNNALLTNYTNQMTALSGKIMCQLVFTNTSGGRVGSLPVLMVVSPAGINEDTVISDSDIEAIIAAQNQYAVLNARLDAAISAATQDSEVQDIRVKADGTSATTAGNAVREQITELKNALNQIGVRSIKSPNLLNPDTVLQNTILNKNTGIPESTESEMYTTDFIPVKGGKEYTCVHTNPSTGKIATLFTNRLIAYDDKKNFLLALDNFPAKNTYVGVTVPNDAAYIRLTSNTYFTQSTNMFCEANGAFPEKIEEYGTKSELEGYALEADLADVVNTVEDIENNVDSIEKEFTYENVLAEVSEVAKETGSITKELGIILSPDQEYIVEILLSIPISADTKMYFRADANLNFIGTLTEGGKEFRFVCSPSGKCSKIRINKVDIDTIVTIKIIKVEDASFQELYDSIKNANLSKYDIPEYWESALDSGIAKVNSNRVNISSRNVEFFFVTDTHWKGNAKHSGELIGFLSEKLEIPFVICGGDIVGSYNAEAETTINELNTFYNAYNKGFNLFTTIGNHDDNGTNNPDTTSFLTYGQQYNTMLKRSEYFAINAPSLRCGYFDNLSQKVRFIQFEKYLPSMSHTGTSEEKAAIIQWVDDRISELSNDWNVVLFSHEFFEGHDPAHPAGDTLNLYSHFVNTEYNANIICWIVGHVHVDASYDEGLLVIATTTDAYRVTYGPEMTLGTDTEQAFDIMQIDLDARKIYCTRIGAGNDRTFSY